MTKKLSRALSVIRRVSCYAPVSVLHKLYYSHFYSHITYAVTTWGNVSRVTVNKITNLQNNVVKLFNGCDRYKFLIFVNIYRLFCLIKLYKILNGDHDYFLERTTASQIEHGHYTRGQADEVLTNIYCRTSCSQQNFLFHAINNWNQIPEVSGALRLF